MLIDRYKAPKVREMPTNPRPILAVSTIPVFRVHFETFQEYVQTVLGFDLDFMHAAGCVPGQCPEYQVTGEIKSNQERQAEDLRQGRRTRNVLLILNLLAHDGYIKPGRYTVSTHDKPDSTQVYRSLLQQTRDPEHPQCLAFKRRHQADKQFAERAVILDQAAMEQLTRGKKNSVEGVRRDGEPIGGPAQ